MDVGCLFWVSFAVIFILVFWIGWYALPVCVLCIFLYMLYRYVKGKESFAEFFGYTIALSIIPAILVVVFMFMKGCMGGLTKGPSYEQVERRTKIHTVDGEVMPTMSDEGEYHNAGTGERQVEYGGSMEQKKDLEAADKLIRDGY